MSDSTTQDCNYPDTAWKQLLRDRDSDALVCIWTKINAWCYTATKRYCSDENVAMSAAIESFEKILQRFEQYALRGSFLGFCRIICVHEVLDQCQRRNRLKDDIDYEEFDEPGSVELDPAHIVDENAILEGLKPCLNELSDRERRVIALRYLTEHPMGSGEYGMSPAEVAIKLKITRNQVNVRACEAYNKLLTCLKRRGFNGINDFLAMFS